MGNILKGLYSGDLIPSENFGHPIEPEKPELVEETIRLENELLNS